MKVGILGGGLSGLTVASFLEADLEVLEKSSECGGLCRSLVEDGFTFDYGGAHIKYCQNQKIVELMRQSFPPSWMVSSLWFPPARYQKMQF